MRKKRMMAMILLLMIGFASVSTSLILNASMKISSNKDDFDVKFIFSNIDKGLSAISPDGKTIKFTTDTLRNTEETALLTYKIKNNSTQYDANVTMNCNNVNSDYIFVENILNGINITENNLISIQAQEVKDGTIKVKLKKSVTEDKSETISCELNVEAGEKIEHQNTILVNINGEETAYSTNNSEIIINNVEFLDDEYVIGCNNDVTVDYTDKTLTIGNIYKDGTCKTYNTFKNIENIDNSKNYIVLLKDETIDYNVVILNKNMHIDWNGKSLTSNITSSQSILIDNNSNVILESSKSGGGVINTGSNNRVIICQNNSSVTVKSGYYYSNTGSADRATIEAGSGTTLNNPINIMGEKADNCTDNKDDYHTGLCIYSETSAAVKNNGSSQGKLNIYGGSMVSKKFAYMTDSRGGQTNIYGGYFEGGLYSIYMLGSKSKTTVNICGGEFNSPIDVYHYQGVNSFAYYKNSGIKWYNNATTPNVSGTYAANVQESSELICSIE